MRDEMRSSSSCIMKVSRRLTNEQRRCTLSNASKLDEIRICVPFLRSYRGRTRPDHDIIS